MSISLICDLYLLRDNTWIEIFLNFYETFQFLCTISLKKMIDVEVELSSVYLLNLNWLAFIELVSLRHLFLETRFVENMLCLKSQTAG